MIYPTITASYAAVLALLFIGLSGWVVATRVKDDALFGDGGESTLQKRIRTQANFAEYVPFAVLLIGYLEASGASSVLVRTLMILLIVARVLHPIGMFAPKNSPQQFACRGGGFLTTFIVIIAAAIMLLIRLA